MRTACTVCGTELIGHPDDDVTCADCEQQNFHGNLLRYPPQDTSFWWLAVRGERGPRPVPDSLRALTRAHGWRWAPDNGTEETP